MNLAEKTREQCQAKKNKTRSMANIGGKARVPTGVAAEAAESQARRRTMSTKAMPLVRWREAPAVQTESGAPEERLRHSEQDD